VIGNSPTIRSSARYLAGILFLVGALLLQGCATPPQTAALRVQPPTLPPYIELNSVPYFAQDAHQCGPASLAMAFGAAGKNIAPEQLQPQVYLPGKSGSLQVEMLAASRRNGFLAYPLAPHLTDLLSEIASGHAVVVFQNLSFNWYPVWHFAVAIGYDLPRGEIILRSGPEQRQVLPFTTFERTWARGNYWALLVIAPDQVPQTATAQNYLESALALEQTGQLIAARASYTAAIQHWPEELGAQMGLGNTAYALGDFASAENAFRRATQTHPDAAVAFNNLADTLARQKKFRDALIVAQRAVALGGEQQAIFAQTLREIEQQLANDK